MTCFGPATSPIIGVAVLQAVEKNACRPIAQLDLAFSNARSTLLSELECATDSEDECLARRLLETRE